MSQCEATYFDGSASVNCIKHRGHANPHLDAAGEWNATGDLTGRIRRYEYRRGYRDGLEAARVAIRALEKVSKDHG